MSSFGQWVRKVEEEVKEAIPALLPEEIPLPPVKVSWIKKIINKVFRKRGSK